MSRLSKLCVPLLAGVAILFSSCEESTAVNATPDGDVTQQQDKVDFDISSTRSVVKFKGELFNIPSPIQTIILLKKADVQYDESLLADIENSTDLINENQKALAIGAYGADLAYLANFENVQLSLEYLKTLEGIASDLDISDNIDKDIIARFSENIGNKDSLYTLNAEFYRAGYRYLKENERSNIASLILLGGWVEALHYALNNADQDNKIKQRIAEQGDALQSLRGLVKQFEGDKQMVSIQQSLDELSKVYDNIESSYLYVEPITDREERKTYFNSQSTADMSPEQLLNIKRIVSDLRNTILN